MDDNNYAALFAGIYRIALRDDCAEVKRQLRDRLTAQGIGRRKVHGYIKANNDLIKKEVGKNLYEEAQAWGSGKTREVRLQNIYKLVNSLVDSFGR